MDNDDADEPRTRRTGISASDNQIRDVFARYYEAWPSVERLDRETRCDDCEGSGVTLDDLAPERCDADKVYNEGRRYVVRETCPRLNTQPGGVLCGTALRRPTPRPDAGVCRDRPPLRYSTGSTLG